MKTIYNLQKGDSYWSKTETSWATLKAIETNIGNEDAYECFKNDLKYGKAFLTEEECQRSIGYDVALAKIKRTFSENYDGLELPILDLIKVYDERRLEYNDTRFLISESYRHAILNLIKELPEECKTVLGVD